MNIADRLMLVSVYASRHPDSPTMRGMIKTMVSEILEALPPELKRVEVMKSMPIDTKVAECQHPPELVREIMDVDDRPADVTYCFWCLAELGRESWFRRYRE